MFVMPASRARPLLRQRDLLGYQLSASVTSGNNLIIGLNQVQGADPFMEFRDPNIANGVPFFRAIPNGSQFVINSGNTLGSANATALRLWVVGFDNGGGISLGAINCSVGGATPTQIFQLDESSVQSPTGGNGGSSAGVFYCAQGLTNRPFRILGYLEWSAGLATAGTWNIKPTKIQLFGLGIKKPGDVVQPLYGSTTSVATVTSSTFTITNNTVTITPTSAANPIRYFNTGSLSNPTPAAANGFLQTFRGATAIGVILIMDVNTAAALTMPMTSLGLDLPNSTSAIIYSVKIKNDNGLASLTYPSATGTSGATMLLDEIMG